MFQNLPPITKNILIINVLMFLAKFPLDPAYTQMMACYYPASDMFKPWQLITSMFMHANFTHIAFNMIGVVMLGSAVERYFGPKRYLFFYIFTGLGALALHFLVAYFEIGMLSKGLDPEQVALIYQDGGETLRKGMNYTNTSMAQLNGAINGSIVGASGALFGILIAFGMKFPNTKLMLLFPPIPIKAKYFVIGYGLIELFLGVNNPGDSVAHFAHIGGMLFGYILIKYWERNSDQWKS